MGERPTGNPLPTVGAGWPVPFLVGRGGTAGGAGGCAQRLWRLLEPRKLLAETPNLVSPLRVAEMEEKSVDTCLYVTVH